MTENERDIIISLKGGSNEQIAKELNISKRTVEKHISNSIVIMRKALKHVLVVLIG